MVSPPSDTSRTAESAGRDQSAVETDPPRPAVDGGMPPEVRSSKSDVDDSKDSRPPSRPLLRRIFGDPDKLDGRSAKQFMSSLRSKYLALKARNTSPDMTSISAEIEKTLDKYGDSFSDWRRNECWDDAYKCERLLVNLYDTPTLEVEINRRILDARDQMLPVAEFYAARVQLPKDTSSPLTPEQTVANRSLLARLIEDLQWSQTQLYLKRGYAHAAQKRVSATFLIGLIIFVVTLYATFDIPPPKAGQQSGGAAETQPEAPNP